MAVVEVLQHLCAGDDELLGDATILVETSHLLLHIARQIALLYVNRPKMDAGFVVGLAGLAATIFFGLYAGSVKKENHRLKQQIQGASQQHVQNVQGDVTINNYVTYTTETKDIEDGGSN